MNVRLGLLAAALIFVAGCSKGVVSPPVETQAKPELKMGDKLVIYHRADDHPLLNAEDTKEMVWPKVGDRAEFIEKATYDGKPAYRIRLLDGEYKGHVGTLEPEYLRPAPRP